MQACIRVDFEIELKQFFFLGQRERERETNILQACVCVDFEIELKKFFFLGQREREREKEKCPCKRAYIWWAC